MSEKKIIFYVDDDPDWQTIIKEGLKEFEIYPVSGQEDLRILLEGKDVEPELFLIDWLLSPGKNETAKSLVVELLRKYPHIPRVVLTTGRGDEGTVSIASELQSTYVEKEDGLDSIRKVILRALEKSAKTRKETVTEEPPKPQKKDLKVEDKELETAGTVQDPAGEKTEFYKMNLESVEKSKRKTDRDNVFLERFINITKSIVDEDLEMSDFAANLLQFLVEYADCSSAAVLSFKDNAGVLVTRKIGSGIDSNREKYITKRFAVGEICSLRQIKELTQSKLEELSSGVRRYTKSIIFPNFRTQTPFAEVRLAEIIDCVNLLFIPVKVNKIAGGAILLFDRVDGQHFADLDEAKIDQLPLSDTLSAAAEMPFRTYDRKGLLKWLTKVISGVISVVSFNKINVKPWDFKQGLLSTYIEVLTLGIAVISVAIISIPGYYVIRYFILKFFTETKEKIHPPHMIILSSIELLLMLLTFILFSLGLAVLFEPRYARGLPKWMLNFTRLSTLEGTILRLVIIILAIHILGRFLLSDDNNVIYTVGELFLASISVCFITGIIGIFTRYFLHEDENSDKEK